MPTVDWNRYWGKELATYLNERPQGEPNYGDKWGDPDTKNHLKRMRDTFVLPFVDKNKTALEIGSGGGRWTKYLLDFGRLYVTDLNKEFFPYLLDRFGPRPNISFCHSSGADLPGIPKNSIDFVFSFGVFVHIETDVIKEYLKTIKEICKEDGDIVIQYSEKNKPQAVANKLYSFNTREIMSGLVKEQGFSIISEDLETLKSANVIHFSPSSPKRAELSD